jgi:hypothetical protein
MPRAASHAALHAALHGWSQQIGVAVDDDGWARLSGLIEAWTRYGRAFNLVGDLRPAALVEHVREGLMAVAAVERLAPSATWRRWTDVGSGAGIPGLVVGAVRAVPLRLIEPRERRAAFLDLCIHSVVRGVGGVIRGHVDRSTWNEMVLGGDLPGEETGPVIASAKAVFAPTEWLDLALSHSSPRDIVVAHVGSEPDQVAGRRSDASVGHGPRSVAAFWGVSKKTKRSDPGD